MLPFSGFLQKSQKLFVLFIAGIIGGGIVYGATQYQQTHLAHNSVLAAKTEVTSVLSSVGKLIELPSNEVPTLATVSDKSKLAGQSFFDNAQNGDKVLLYAVAKKAILYRPSINKIIDVAPLNIVPPSITPAASISSGAKVVLANGTASKSAEIIQVAMTTIKNALPDVVILRQENAANSDYIKNLIVDVSGKYTDTETTLSQLLHARVTTKLPPNETKPQDADILVILGQK